MAPAVVVHRLMTTKRSSPAIHACARGYRREVTVRFRRAVIVAALLVGAAACGGDDDTTVPPGDGREVIPGEEGPVE